MLGLRFCARAFSSCDERGPLFIAVRRPLTMAASLVVEHRLQTRRLSSCGSRAQLLCGMWDPPRPGHEPVSPALTGRFSTTAPPAKPCNWVLIMEYAQNPCMPLPGLVHENLPRIPSSYPLLPPGRRRGSCTSLRSSTKAVWGGGATWKATHWPGTRTLHFAWLRNKLTFY